MEDTVIPEQTHPFKGLPMRVSYMEQDYTIRLLQKSMDRNTVEFRILLDGIMQTLKRVEKRWYFDGHAENRYFAQAIWHTVSFRYRF